MACAKLGTRKFWLASDQRSAAAAPAKSVVRPEIKATIRARTAHASSPPFNRSSPTLLGRHTPPATLLGPREFASKRTLLPGLDYRERNSSGKNSTRQELCSRILQTQ